jgi:predicted outer membrane repeat protein
MASSHGGAIFIPSGVELTLSGSVLSGNSSSNQGGAIRSSGTLVITGSQFLTNTAYAGGAVYNYGSATFTDSELTGNIANDDGGAILISSGSVTLTGTLLSANDADDQGGAVRNSGTVSAISSSFLNNIAANGGAIYSSSGAPSSADQSCFSGNSATAVHSAGSTVRDFTDNWWGAASGPSGSGPGTGDSVNSSINYTPWLTNDNCQP